MLATCTSSHALLAWRNASTRSSGHHTAVPCGARNLCRSGRLQPSLLSTHLQKRSLASVAPSVEAHSLLVAPTPGPATSQDVGTQAEASQHLAQAASPCSYSESWWQRLGKKFFAVAAFGALAVSVMLASPSVAMAARSSGGRIGGRSFGSSMGHSSSGFSSKSSSSHGGGGGGSGSSMLGSGSYRSYAAPSPSWSMGSRTTIIAPSPFIAGGAFVEVPSAPLAVPYGYQSMRHTWFDSMLDGVILMALLAVIALPLMSSLARGGAAGSTVQSEVAPRCVEVARVQVAVLGSARARLQQRFERLAEEVDTRTAQGLHTLLQEVVLLLMRNPEYFAYGHVSGNVTVGDAAAERLLDRLSLEERSKFKEETLVNFRGRRRAGALAGPDRRAVHDPRNELVVVTVLVAARCGKGGLGLPPRLGSWKELQGALGALGAVRQEDVLAVELMWTPEAPEDTMTREDLVEDYPDLIPL